MEVRLALLYGSTVTIRNELAELRQSVGTASYQIGEELEASFLIIVSSRTTHPTIEQYQEILATRPPKSIHIPL